MAKKKKKKVAVELPPTVKNLMFRREASFNLRDALEAIILDDKPTLAKLKKRCQAIKNFNEKVKAEYEAKPDEKSKREMINKFTFPEVNDEFINSEAGNEN